MRLCGNCEVRFLNVKLKTELRANIATQTKVGFVEYFACPLQLALAVTLTSDLSIGQGLFSYVMNTQPAKMLCSVKPRSREAARCLTAW